MRYQIPRVFRVAAHTKNVGLSSTFVAIPGTRNNGNNFVSRAIRACAGKIVIERGSKNSSYAAQQAWCAGVPVDYVDCARRALATYSAHAYGYPQRDLYMSGITGTKGKTTTAAMLAHILRWSGCSTALLSSVGGYINDVCVPTSLTTPQPDYIYAFLHCCRIHGVRHVVMEVAAQALSLHRVDGITFDAVIVTNISHEHGEFYSTHVAYVAAKRRIMQHTHRHSLTLLNGDDRIVAAMRPAYGAWLEYGFSSTLSQPARIMSQPQDPLVCMHPVWPSHIEASIYGTANGYNLVAAVLCAQSYQVPWHSIVQSVNCFAGVPGRMEEIQLRNGAVACLDYAHNVASCRAMLSALRCRFAYVCVVFGASGERDRAKRQYMAQTACAYADIIVLTLDNPRCESINQIMQDLYTGIDPNVRLYEIRDRAEAIIWACSNIPSYGVVAVLGKGRDAYQEINGVTYYHSDYDAIIQARGNLL